MGASLGAAARIVNGKYSYPRFSQDSTYLICDDRERKVIDIFMTSDLKLPE